MRVYILSVGEFIEEYAVVGVFSSIEKVEEFKRKFPERDYNDPEKIEIDYIPDINDQKLYIVESFDNIFEIDVDTSIIRHIDIVNKDLNDDRYVRVLAKSEEEALEKALKLLKEDM